MKLLINTASAYKGGSIQVAKSFIEECREFSEHDYYVVLGLSIAGLIRPETFPPNFDFFRIDYRPATRVFSLRSRLRFFSQIEKTIRPDVVFTTSGPAYWRPEAPHLVGYNLPHYVYPESVFFSRLPAGKRLKWRLKGSLIRRAFTSEADAYVVQTEAVGLRVKKLLNTERVYVVSNTCGSHYFMKPVFPDRLPERTAGEFRLLTLSSWYAHKNLAIIRRIVEAMPPAWRERIRFVLTLPHEDYIRNFPEGCREQIINVGPVPIEQGPSIYGECDAMFLPTLLECFSASYPEAMAMGKPILTSDIDFARSICREAALYFDPTDPRDIVEKILDLASSAELQADMTARGAARLEAFGTARSRAGEYLRICAELAGLGQ